MTSSFLNYITGPDLISRVVQGEICFWDRIILYYIAIGRLHHSRSCVYCISVRSEGTSVVIDQPPAKCRKLIVNGDRSKISLIIMHI